MSPPVRAGLVSVCSTTRSCSSRRPVRAAEAVRSRSSEEGGLGTRSSSWTTRRARFSAGAVRATFAIAARFLRAAGSFAEEVFAAFLAFGAVFVFSAVFLAFSAVFFVLAELRAEVARTFLAVRLTVTLRAVLRAAARRFGALEALGRAVFFRALAREPLATAFERDCPELPRRAVLRPLAGAALRLAIARSFHLIRF